MSWVKATNVQDGIMAKEQVQSLESLESVGQYHVKFVAKDGNDTTGDGSIPKPFLTIKAALASITDNSDTNRYVIKVAPGVYVEDNPLVMKSNVDILGDTSLQQVNITAGNPSSSIITAAADSGISRIILRGTTDIAVDCSQTGIFVIRDISLSNCARGLVINNTNALVDVNLISAYVDSGTMTNFIEMYAGKGSIVNVQIVANSVVTTGVLVDGSDSLMFLVSFITNTNNITTAVNVTGGADLTLNGARITGDLGDRIGTAVKVTGTDSHCDALSLYIQHADYGVYVDGSSSAHLAGAIIDLCDYGLYTHTSGSPIIHHNGGKVSNSLTWDVYLSTTTSTLLASGVSIDENKLYLDGANVSMAHVSTNPGDEGLGVKGELHVGSPEKGAESVLGEGDSYTRGLLAYTYDGSDYTDISTSVKSYSGSTFTFPNNSVNTAIYLSSDLENEDSADYHQAFGIKMALTTAQVGGTIVAEYWNGTAWTEFNTMTSLSGGTYYRKSNLLFAVDAGSYQVRYNPNIAADWTKNNDPSYAGGDRYWVRYRITSSPSTLPVFEQWKLHSNRTEVNADGYMEHMGTARPYVGISVPWSSFQDAGGSVADQDLWVSTNCKTGFINNNFNSDGDSVGTVLTIPPWVDTSGPMRLIAILVPATTGTLVMKAFLNSSTDGDTISTTDPTSTTGETSQTISKAVTAGQQVTYSFSLDISDKGIEGSGIAPRTLWINLEADSRPGNVYGMVFQIAFLNWRSGRHVSSLY